MNFCSGLSARSSSRSPSLSGGSTFAPSSSSALAASGPGPAVRSSSRLLVVNRHPAGELRHRSLDAEEVRRRFDVDRRFVERRRRHLRSDEPVPDQAIEVVLVRRQVRPDLVGVILHRRRPDRLVRVLRVRLGAVVGRFLGHVVRPELLADELAHVGQRLIGDAGRVGSHVGDEADRALTRQLDALVELLGDHHRLLHREARRLLQLARDERRNRALLALLGRDRRDRPLAPASDRRGRRSDSASLPILMLAPSFFRSLASNSGGTGPARRAVRFQYSSGTKAAISRSRSTTSFSATDCTRPALKPAPDLVPEQRADLVADQPVEHAARLLRVDHLLVDLRRLLERREHTLLGDLVEHQAADLLAIARAELLGEMPADRFALAVGVGRDKDLGGLLRPRPSAR